MYFASQRKRQLDQKLGDMPHWTVHDLRRTARSLLSRAGVRPDIAERVLGHAIAGVEGVSDRHPYDTEKAEALAKLAALVERIIHPPGRQCGGAGGQPAPTLIPFYPGSGRPGCLLPRPQPLECPQDPNSAPSMRFAGCPLPRAPQDNRIPCPFKSQFSRITGP